MVLLCLAMRTVGGTQNSVHQVMVQQEEFSAPLILSQVSHSVDLPKNDLPHIRYHDYFLWEIIF